MYRSEHSCNEEHLRAEIVELKKNLHCAEASLTAQKEQYNNLEVRFSTERDIKQKLMEQ